MKITKILFVAIAIVSLAFTSCKDKAAEQPKEDGYVVNGTVKGLDNGYLKISEYTFFNQEEARVIDSVPIVDGKFKVEGKVDFSDMVSVNVGKYFGSFILENSDIQLTIDLRNLKDGSPRFESEVKGSKSHAEYLKVTKKARSVYDEGRYPKLDEYNKISREVYKSKDSVAMADLDKQIEELAPIIEKRQNEFNSIIYDYVRQNPSSSIAPHVMGVNYTEGRMSPELLKEFYNVFEGDARKTGFFKNFITKIYKDNFENIGVGNTAPDFTLETVKGEQLTLSKVEGKYILVDFWASWCVPCRASFPHLKELRKQYKDKGFTIVGVGTADKQDKWEKAIKEDNTPWNHVFDKNEEGKNMYGPVAEAYGVPHLPTTLLLDSDRKIVLRNPTKQELDDKLKELFE